MSKPEPSAKSDIDTGSRYGIYRRHDRRHDVYRWEVSIGRDGRVVGYACFSDRKYGGADAALRAAETHRDRLLQQFPPTPRAVISQRLTTRNTSGHPGVHPVRQKNKLIGCCARTTLPDGTILSRYFGFHTHGKARAIELAIEERQRQLLQVDSVALRSPVAKQTCPLTVGNLALDRLRPRSRHVGPKPLAKPRPDPVREDKIATRILQRHGRRQPGQPGSRELRWIGRYRSPKHGTAGWRVAITRNGRWLAGRIFMDARHGGAARGFELACRYRDEQILALQLP